MPGIFDKVVGEVKSRVNAVKDAVKAGNQETTGLGHELAERAKMQRAALGSPAPPDKPAAAAAAGEKMNSGARYGDRPGEKRIDVKDMVKPLGVPVYDKGGKVKKANLKDGKHQVAILKEGERVLTEKQNKKYEKKGEKVMATPYDMVSAPKKAPKVVHHHEYSKTHNGKHVVTHKHHDPSHKDETHMFDKFSDAAEHMNANPPQPEPEAPAAAPAAGGAPTAAPAAGGAPAAPAAAMPGM